MFQIANISLWLFGQSLFTESAGTLFPPAKWVTTPRASIRASMAPEYALYMTVRDAPGRRRTRLPSISSTPPLAEAMSAITPFVERTCRTATALIAARTTRRTRSLREQYHRQLQRRARAPTAPETARTIQQTTIHVWK